MKCFCYENYRKRVSYGDKNLNELCHAGYAGGSLADERGSAYRVIEVRVRITVAMEDQRGGKQNGGPERKNEWR